jgi:lysophospholipase L1-like esterase
MPKVKIKKWLYVTVCSLLIIVTAWLLAASMRIFFATRNTEKLIVQIQPYRQAGTGQKSILFIGDSFAYGTGASSSDNTMAGLVGNHFPGFTIVNKARNGTKTEDLANRIVKDVDRRYDLIFVMVGANDVIHPEVNLGDSQRHLARIYARAADNADHVIAVTSGDFKDVSFFLPPLNHYFGYRSERLNDVAQYEASRFSDVRYIDGLAENSKPEEPGAFESEDRLHLNDIGTHYWFQRILEKTGGLAFD